MAAVNFKSSTTLQSDQSGTLTGYDLEGGATETTINSTFPANSVNAPLTMSFTVANLQSFMFVSDKGCTLKTNGTNTADVQTITITGTPTGGNFPLIFGGQATVVAYNSTNATVQTALQLLSSIGSGNITCSGGPLPGTPIACTFAGTLAPGFRALIGTSSVGLTGGSSPAVTIAHTTPGGPQDTFNLKPGIPFRWNTSAGYYTMPFAGNVTNASVTTTIGTRLQGKILSS